MMEVGAAMPPTGPNFPGMCIFGPCFPDAFRFPC